MSKFLHDSAKAIAIPQVFSENSRAKNQGLFGKGLSHAVSKLGHKHLSDA